MSAPNLVPTQVADEETFRWIIDNFDRLVVLHKGERQSL